MTFSATNLLSALELFPEVDLVSETDLVSRVSETDLVSQVLKCDVDSIENAEDAKDVVRTDAFPVFSVPIFPTSIQLPIVKLVWITPEAQTEIGVLARVSSPDDQRDRPVVGLLKYLIRNKHWSPFEMADLCVEINTTRDISAQIIRHRSFSFQEFSQRYASVTEFPPIPHFRRQDSKNRQASIDDLSAEIQFQLQERTRLYFAEGQILYQDLLAAGVAKECARKVLPMNSPTRIYMKGSIRSWIHYLQIRNLKEGTQLEHALIGEEIKKIFARELPAIYAAVFVD